MIRKGRLSVLAVLIFALIVQFAGIAFAGGGVTVITHGWRGDMAWVNDAGDKLVNRIATEYLDEVNDGNSGVALYLMTLSDEHSVSIDCKNGVSFGSFANTTGHAVINLIGRI